MNDLKNLQTKFIKNYSNMTIPAKVVHDFPMSIQSEVDIECVEEEFSYGGFLNYAFTKGRLYYGDYSGHTSTDQKVNRIVIGGIGRYSFSQRWKAYSKLGINFSSLNINFETILDNLDEKEELNFNSKGFSFEPGLSYNIIIKPIVCNFNFGYEINIQGQTKFSKDSNAYLLANEEEALINWSGMRLGLSIGLSVD